jgi:hypothetical protein
VLEGEGPGSSSAAAGRGPELENMPSISFPDIVTWHNSHTNVAVKSNKEPIVNYTQARPHTNFFAVLHKCK